MDKVYRLKITLKNVKPAVWRRVLVEDSTDLQSLHAIIQAVMGWSGSHLFQFIINGQYYSELSDESDDFNDAEPAEDYALNEFVVRPKQKITYEYDFGDGWEHEILLEEILDKDSQTQYPECIAGKMACPPEDCGGPWGYAELLEVIKNPKHPEHEDMMDWLGGEFDPEYFSVEEVNEALQG